MRRVARDDEYDTDVFVRFVPELEAVRLLARVAGSSSCRRSRLSREPPTVTTPWQSRALPLVVVLG